MVERRIGFAAAIALALCLCSTGSIVAQPAGDLCANAPLINCNSSTTFDNTLGTVAPEDPLFSCHFNVPAQGVGTTWFTFVATDTSAQVSTCNSAVSDTLIGVYDGACGSFAEIGCSEDACGGGFGFLSRVCVEGLTIGQTYYIQVASFSASSLGSITLDLECPCPAATSACCVGQTCSTVDGSVTGSQQFDCEDPIELGGLGGVWLGDGTDCLSSACPPDNDTCDAATPLTIPSSITFNNDSALPSSVGGSGSCNSSGVTDMQNDVWFTVTTGETPCDLNLELESTNFYDMIVTVYTGSDCFDLFEIACGDEPDDPLIMSVPTTPNTTYWIRVGDWGASEGGGETTMSINCTASCNSCVGDVNDDFLVNGADIQDYADCYLGNGTLCGCADMDRDGDIDDSDTVVFVDRLLNLTGDCLPVACEAGSDGQSPEDTDALSSNGEFFETADNFRVASNGSITHARWWGGYLPAAGCPDSADAFVITYYNDNNGRPGTTKAGPFNVTASRFQTGRSLAGIAPEWVFVASHAPVAVSAGDCVWISIKTPDTTSCTWFWSISLGGDGACAQSDVPGTWPKESRIDNDLAFCVDVQIDPAGCPAPTGACCTAGMVCNDSIQANCGGVWNYDEACSDFVCVDAPTDSCAGATTLECNSSVTFDNTSYTTDIDDPLYSCHFTAPEQGVGTAWAKFIATDTSARVSTCNSAISDTLIAVYDGTCGAFVELGCSEDDCGGSGLLSDVCVEGLTIGNTYYIQVASFDEFSQGSITLDLECPCPVVPTVDNDECDTAIMVNCGDSILFDNTLATPDFANAPSPLDPVPSCSFGGNPAQATVWYTFIGDGQVWTIQSCNTANVAASIGDTTLSIWTGECGVLTEIACGEDDCFGGDVADQGGVPEQWMSSVDVLTANGVQYWIMWSNAFADRGEILMDISCAP